MEDNQGLKHVALLHIASAIALAAQGKLSPEDRDLAHRLFNETHRELVERGYDPSSLVIQSEAPSAVLSIFSGEDALIPSINGADSILVSGKNYLAMLHSKFPSFPI